MKKSLLGRGTLVRSSAKPMGLIHYVRRYRKAMERYQHDALTGLLDREGLEERVERWGRRHAPTDQFAMAFVDLNDFKQVNDKYGHGRGDEALKMVADLLTHSFRRKDELIARVGGDEFALFLPFTEGSALRHRRGRDRHYDALSNYLIEIMECELRRRMLADPSNRFMREIGFAVGVRVYRQRDIHRGVNKLLDTPDKAMYRVKQLQKSSRQ